MIRFFFGAVGSVFLALALVFAIADIARSLAEDLVRFTPLGQALASVGLDAAPVAGPSRAAIDVVALMSAWPASAVLGALALLFLFLGRPRRRRRDRMPG